jgi:hypothetical protein
MTVAATVESATAPASERSHRVLDPIARTSEVLFGLIMALTFTGTLGAATAGREEVRTLLIGMIGCNIAWGLVDAVMYLMSTLTERGRNLVTLRALQTAPTAAAAHQVIRDALPPLVAATLTSTELERARQGLLRAGGPQPKASLSREDWLGAIGVFLLVVFSTFPVVVPFLVFNRVHLALRVSNAIAIVMLFCLGYWLGDHAGYRPWRTGASMVLLGVVLVGIAITLGG